MAGTTPDYPPAIVVCSTTGTGVQSSILDIGAFNSEGFPPVLAIYISATATVKVWGAMSVTASSTPALVRKIDYSAGGFTTSDAYDLVPGIRFWQIEVTANTGEVTVEAGFGPQGNGRMGLPQLLRMSNNAPQGT
jgi:hypothetical protein